MLLEEFILYENEGSHPNKFCCMFEITEMTMMKVLQHRKRREREPIGTWDKRTALRHPQIKREHLKFRILQLERHELERKKILWILYEIKL